MSGRPCARGCGSEVAGRIKVCDACSTLCARGCGRRVDVTNTRPYCKPCLDAIELDLEARSLRWTKNPRGVFVRSPKGRYRWFGKPEAIVTDRAGT